MSDQTQVAAAETPVVETPETTEAATIPSSQTTPPTTEAEVEAGKTLLSDEPAKDEPKAEVEAAPEKYEDFKLPEGVELKPEALAEAQTLFKDLGLSQAKAQQLVDFHTKAVQEMAAANQQAYTQLREGWRKEVTSDPEIGAALKDVKAVIGRAKVAIGDQKLVDNFNAIMDQTGVGDNLAFIKVFYKMAKAMTEGSHVAGAGPTRESQTGSKPATGAQALYPNLP